MKNLTRPLASLLLYLALTACSSQPSPNHASGSSTVPAIRNDAPDAIVRGTLISKSGDTLEYRYDNQVHTMDIDFKRIHSTLRQDTAASGIKYSNEEFIYTEWHGISTLRQKGNTVFETDSGVK
jgi:hypothetical protein